MSFLWSKKDDLLLGDELRKISFDSATRRDLVLRNYYSKVQDAVVKLLKDRAATTAEKKTAINLERLFIDKYTTDGPHYTMLGNALMNELKQGNVAVTGINFTAAELNSYGTSLNTYLSAQHLNVTFVSADSPRIVRIVIDWTPTDKELVVKEETGDKCEVIEPTPI